MKLPRTSSARLRATEQTKWYRKVFYFSLNDDQYNFRLFGLKKCSSFQYIIFCHGVLFCSLFPNEIYLYIKTSFVIDMNCFTSQ